MVLLIPRKIPFGDVLGSGVTPSHVKSADDAWGPNQVDAASRT